MCTPCFFHKEIVSFKGLLFPRFSQYSLIVRFRMILVCSIETSVVLSVETVSCRGYTAALGGGGYSKPGSELLLNLKFL